MEMTPWHSRILLDGSRLILATTLICSLQESFARLAWHRASIRGIARDYTAFLHRLL
jgi:hypothetical protein